MGRRGPAASRALRAAFPLFALLSGVVAAVALTHLTAWLLGIDLRSRIHRLKLEVFPPPPMGLQIADPTLGWTNNPDAIVRQTRADFDVVYRIDEQEGRHVPGRPDSAPLVSILGGSFTFGQGVEDDETFAAILQARHWPDWAVRLRASNGWGTAQAYVALSEDLARRDDVRLALYGWLPFHNGRNHLGATWLEAVGRSNQRLPHFSVRDGLPVFERLVGPEDALPDDRPERIEAEWQTTEALLREMHRTAREHGCRFVFVFLPFEGQQQDPNVARMKAFLAQEGIEVVLLELRASDYARGLRLPVDGHPNAAWHALVAQELARSLALAPPLPSGQ
jgi:hypothetical protein